MSNAARNGVLIECDDEEDCEKLLTETVNKLGDEFSVRRPTKRFPRIKILKVNDVKCTDDEFLTELKLRNANISEDDFEVVRREQVLCKGKEIPDCFNFVLQVSGGTFNKIMTTQKLKFGWSICKVVDNIYIRRCYNCYGFNHNASECRNRPVCSRCGSEHHKLRECNQNTESCINCLCANDKLKSKLEVHHNVWSNECSVYQHKLQISKRSINYVE